MASTPIGNQMPGFPTMMPTVQKTAKAATGVIFVMPWGYGELDEAARPLRINVA
jgi:hypothetical protein